MYQYSVSVSYLSILSLIQTPDYLQFGFYNHLQIRKLGFQEPEYFTYLN